MTPNQRINKMTELEKVKSDAFEAISKYPHLEEAINDGYGLVIDAINDGCSEEKAKAAIEDAEGDLAEAIMNLTKEE